MRNLFEISIIIPVYNSSRYLDACISSVLQQTYSDFELLLIDDGSLDNSLEICEKYALSDKRIRVYSKKNGGVSSARNLGLSNANGKWICFIDSDDTIEMDFLENFNLTTCDVNLYIQGYKRVDVDGHILAIHQFENKGYNTDVKNAYIEAEMKLIMNSPWCKLFDVMVIKNNNIIFDEFVSLSEDLMFTLDYMKFVNKVNVSGSTSYCYFIRDGESLTKKYVPYNQIQYTTEYIKKRRYELIDKYKIASDDFLGFVNRNYIHRCILAVISLYDSRAKLQKERKTILVEYRKIFMSNDLYSHLNLHSSFCSIVRYLILHPILNLECSLYCIINLRNIYLKLKQ